MVDKRAPSRLGCVKVCQGHVPTLFMEFKVPWLHKEVLTRADCGVKGIKRFVLLLKSVSFHPLLNNCITLQFIM